MKTTIITTRKIMTNMYKYSVKREFAGKVGDESASYQISKPETVAQYLKLMGLHEDEQENFVVLFLDTRNKVKGFDKVTRGLVDRSHVHPREVFRAAIIAGASKVILCHNHPSGDCSPSKQDLTSTKNLCEAGEIIGIKVLDHVIVGEKLGEFNWLSMRNSGQFPS